MRKSILYFFLLMLKIPLNHAPDAGYKQSRFFKILSKKSLEFIFSRRGSTVLFNLGLMLLLAEIDLVAKKRSCKGHVLRDRGIGYVKIILALPTEIIVLHM